MGLDLTHDCWHGAYSAFHRWRQKIAYAAGMPPLDLMDGMFTHLEDGRDLPTLYCQKDLNGEYPHRILKIDALLPILWSSLKPDPLHTLLHHSDCDGELAWEDCAAIADRLEELLPELPDVEDHGHIGNWRDKTSKFIDGLRDAASRKENVLFQ